MARRAAKIDNNHADICNALRAAGCHVQSLAAVGRGCPDILVGNRRTGMWYVIEIKSEAKPKLTPAEVEWVLRVRNMVPVHVVETVEQALEITSAK
jgi:Holliday junction resolvase